MPSHRPTILHVQCEAMLPELFSQPNWQGRGKTRGIWIIRGLMKIK